MSSMVKPACLYLVYLGAFLVFFGLIGREDASEMFSAVGQPFLEAPYRTSPDRILYDVRGSEQVYEWISAAFIPNLYSEVNYEEAADTTTSNSSTAADSLEGECTQGTTSGVDSLRTRSDAYAASLTEASSDDCPATLVGTSDVQVSLGQYNRVWLGRLTLKRRKLISHTSKAFSNAYSTAPSISRVNPKGSTSAEDTDTFSSAEGGRTYTYDEGGGWRGTGGFVQYFNFSNQSAVVATLDNLHDDSWFDMRQGSLTLDFLAYNGNINAFLHLSFTFEHDYAGKTKVMVESSPLDLTLHDSASPQAYVRFAIYILIMGLFLYFVRQELIIDEVSTDNFMSYISNVTNVLHCMTLVLCAYCIILYLLIVASYTYLHLNFIDSGQLSVTQFEDLSNLAHSMEHFLAVMAATLFFMCIRGVAVLAVLIPQIKLVVHSLDNVKYQLFAYVATVIVTLSAFQLAGYFFFGSRLEAFSGALFCVISCTKMLMKEQNSDRLAAGDSTVSTLFFLVFHIFFLVIHQILLCMLIKGYLEEREAWKKLADLNNTPVKRILQRFFSRVTDNSACLHRFFSWCMPRPGLTSARINWVQVSLLRQRRATKLRTRTVIYDVKPDEDNEVPEILKDIHFTVVKPNTRDGLLQFYAAHVPTNGQAYEAGLREGYRLVEIQTPTLKDREAFRQVPDQKPEGSRSDLLDPIRNLKAFPVTLVFEGQPQPIAWECLGLILYVLIFLLFAVVVTRNTDALQMHLSQVHALTSPWWTDCSPERTISFEGISDMNHIDSWISAALVNNGYQCSSLLDYNGAISCEDVERAANATGDRREDWYLWQGPSVSTPTDEPYEAKTTSALGYYPAAAGGLSLGFIPHTPPARAGSSGTQCSTEASNTLEEKICSCTGQVRFGLGDVWSDWVDVSSSIECRAENFGMDTVYASRVCLCRDDRAETTQVLAFDHYNVGVMPNNHVRLTVQQQCFVKNDKERWQGGAPFILASQLSDTCSDSACMKEASEDENLQCYNRHGVLQASYPSLTGGSSNVSYAFKETGSFDGLGGLVLGFGNTRGEAAAVAGVLSDDGILAAVAASAVFEYVVYNANYDLFELVTVRFNLRGSGQVDKNVDTTVFPLRVFTMGSVDASPQSSHVMNWMLFFTYCLACLIFLLAILSDLFTQYNITKALLRPASRFPVDFLLEEPWNVMDVIILILNIVIIDALVRFMFMESTASVREGVSSWTSDYAFSLQSNLLTEDQFENLKSAATLWRRFGRTASLNGLLLLIRVIKYSGAGTRLRMVILALGKALMEVSMVISLHLCLTAGFAVMWFVHFGVVFPSARSVVDSILLLSMFHVGRFGVDDLVSWSPVFSVLFVPIFYLVFSLLINMMLAIMVYCWREVRKDAQSFPASLTKKKKGPKGSDAVFGSFPTLDGEGDDTFKLESDFWRDLGLLQHLETLNEHGKLKPAPREKRLAMLAGASASSARSEDGADDDGNMAAMVSGTSEARHKFDTPEDLQRFNKVFRKAVLELVSTLSKDHHGGPLAMAGHTKLGGSPTSRRSRPGHTGSKTAGHLASHAEKEKEKELQEEALAIGIIETEVSTEDVLEIESSLARKLENLPDFSLELWLDTLITALEFESIDTLQKILLPPPQIMPKKQQEWNAFKAKKVDRELRLDCFFKLLQLKARTKRCEYLKEIALEKSRILKEQSLVMTDYWESLEEQLDKTRHALA